MPPPPPPRLLALGFLTAVAHLGVVALAAQAVGGDPGASAPAYSLAVGAPSGPSWAHGQTLYQVFLQRHTPEGTIDAFRQNLPRLRALGVGVVWLMPIHPMGELLEGNRNPFRIRDHFAVDAGLGTEADLRALIGEVHALGMHIILGVVPNHTGYDHPLAAEHPERYYHTAEGAIASVGPWPHLAHLDYTRADTRQWGYEYFRHWADFGFDGFRVDVAKRMPVDYWAWVLPRMRREFPGLLWLAEADEPAHRVLFDLVYDWTTAPTLWRILDGEWGVAALDSVLLAEAQGFAGGHFALRHTDNHDLHNVGVAHPLKLRVPGGWTERNVSLYERYGAALELANVLYATLPGAYMIFNGQEASFGGSLPHNTLAPGTIDWGDTTALPFYRRLTALRRDEPALGGAGALRRVPVATATGVFAFERRAGARSVLVAVNLSDGARTVDLGSGAGRGAYREYFTDARTEDLGAVELGPFGYKVFVSTGEPADGSAE